MPVTPMKLSITKSMPWRGGTEEFSNVYVIDGLDNSSDAAMDAAINAAVTAEKLIHANIVSFVRAQLYSFGDFGPNFMYASKSLSGVGGAGAPDAMYRECAIMIRAKLPRTFSLSRSNQPYLRKYLHTCKLFGREASGSTAPTWQDASLSLGGYVNWLENPGAGLKIVSESGSERTADWEACDFLEHRQLHKGRKEY